MKPIPEDYKPQDGFTIYKDGEYSVNKIEWFSIDKKTNKPLLVMQAGTMVGRLRFTVAGEEDGPPYSIALGDMALLLRAFHIEAKLPEVPPHNRPDAVAIYMETIEQVINSAGKQTKVTVNSGWVQNIEGMDVPEMYGYYRVVDVTPRNSDGMPEAKPGTYGPFFFVKFEVLAGEGGTVSPYKGATFTELVPYAVTVQEVEGIPTPDWEKGSSGAYTANAKRISRLLSFTAPALFNGEPVFSNPYNLLADWYTHLKEKGCQPIKGSRIKAKNGRITLDLINIHPVEGFVNGAGKAEEKDNLHFLKEMLTLLTGSPAFVQGSIVLTAQGRETAKKYLTPLKEAKTISGGKFSDLTAKEIGIIFASVLLDNDLDEDTLEALVALHTEFLGEEEEPF